MYVSSRRFRDDHRPGKAVAQRIFMARSTKEEALETRNRILDAAEDVFHAYGVSRTSLADVAVAASVSRGAIYWHFKNKSDLFDAMCERVRLPMEDMAAAGKDVREIDPLQQLRKTLLFVLSEVRHNPHSRKVLGIVFHKCEFVEAAGSIVERQQDVFLRGRADLETILRNAVVRKQLPAELDTALASVMMQAQIDGLINISLFTPDSADFDAHAERMVDAAIEMLRCAPSLRSPQVTARG
jgi:TetR/AcrR family acrAB operon transcriptional repressor